MSENTDLTISQDEQSSTKFLTIQIIRNWWLFLISLVICLFFGYLYLSYKTPLFQVAVKLIVDDDKKGAAGNGMDAASAMFGDLSGLLNTQSSVDNEVEILKTRFLMESTVKDLKLNVTYLKKGFFRNKQIYVYPYTVDIVKSIDTIRFTSLSFDHVDSTGFKATYLDAFTNDKNQVSALFGKPFKIGGVGTVIITKNKLFDGVFTSDYVININSLDQTVVDLQNLLDVSVTNKDVSTIDITLGYPLPKKGEDILGDLIRIYIQSNIANKSQIADSTIAFIEGRLLLVSKELNNIEGSIQQFKQSNGLADIDAQSKLLVGNSDTYIKQLSDLETQLNLSKALQEYLKDEKTNKRVVPSSILPNDPIFDGLVQRYNALVLERDKDFISTTDENPFIQNLNERITSTRADMLSNLSNTVRSINISKAQLLKNSGQLQSKIRDVPSQERTYLDLERQQQIKQTLYIYLLQKREETAISKTSNLSNSRIIDPAKSAVLPYDPKRTAVWICALLAGLLLPIAWIYLKESFNTKIQSKKDIVKLTKVPVIGEISHNSSEDIVVVKSDSRTAISEQFRALRTNLHFFINSEKKGRTILLTSSMSGEGKSFTASNIGAALAISGKKVVMLELDLRKPKLSQGLGAVTKYGVTNYVIDTKITLEETINPTKIHENLFIISAGPIPPNPAETLLNARIDEMITKLKLQFDYLIIDTPPIGVISDSQLINKYADLTLYLVRQKYTFKEQINIVDELYKSKKFNNLAIVINDISIRQGYGYGYGYGYSYGYGYGYGYESDLTPKTKGFKNFFKGKKKYS